MVTSVSLFSLSGVSFGATTIKLSTLNVATIHSLRRHCHSPKHEVRHITRIETISNDSNVIVGRDCSKKQHSHTERSYLISRRWQSMSFYTDEALSVALRIITSSDREYFVRRVCTVSHGTVAVFHNFNSQ